MNSQFKALNDKTRRDVLELLKSGDLSAGEIAENFDMAKPSISHHLEILRNAGFVSSQKRGQYVFYSLNTSLFEEIVGWMMKLIDSNKEKQ